ncbi:MAG: hypothetical protein KIH62_000585 [Candidatus Kerfeldbacteria bacterium]|nr:hypothetical protein [Candidatus Kerfeldbacteria bacterium]
MFNMLLACENFHYPQDPRYFDDDDFVSESIEISMVAVAGVVEYNQVRQNGVHLFLVDDDFNLVDQDINESTGGYQLSAEEPESYWLLAGYDYSFEPLMAYKRLSLEEGSEPEELNIDLEPISMNVAQDYLLDSACYCSASVWRMTFWSCEMESGWAWSECD